MLDNILFIPGIRALDPDAKTYINAVEFADGQPLESAVRTAIDKFVRGCKADGIWDAIKASCILAGARTLDGALIPLKGSAPTNNGPFVSGDYNRKTGLVGNGTTKYLNSNRNNNADPQNSNHISVFRSALPTSGAARVSIGGGRPPESGITRIAEASAIARQAVCRSRTSVAGLINNGIALGFCGISRSVAASYQFRGNATNTTITETSQTPLSRVHFIFAANGPSGNVDDYSNETIQFYSIGESLNLAQLDARVTTLINTFGAVI
jgi:hypothetical protein